MKDQLQKAMDISRKTGDRLIIFDTARTGEAYVIMPLDEYEKNVFNGANEARISDLTEDELIDKINCDIAAWKSEKSKRERINKKIDNFRQNYGKMMDYEEDGGYEDILGGYEDDYDDYSEEKDDFAPPNSSVPPFESFDYEDEEVRSDDRKNQKNRNPWDIPTDRKKAAEEIIEEDRQYLEEI